MSGSIGTVVKIVYTPGKAPPQLPEVVYVNFPGYLGQSALEGQGYDKVVPIIPMTVDWIGAGNKPCQRTALPLRLCYSATFHKCQGESNFILNEFILYITNDFRS